MKLQRKRMTVLSEHVKSLGKKQQQQHRPQSSASTVSPCILVPDIKTIFALHTVDAAFHVVTAIVKDTPTTVRQSFAGKIAWGRRGRMRTSRQVCLHVLTLPSVKHSSLCSPTPTEIEALSHWQRACHTMSPASVQLNTFWICPQSRVQSHKGQLYSSAAFILQAIHA